MPPVKPRRLRARLSGVSLGAYCVNSGMPAKSYRGFPAKGTGVPPDRALAGLEMTARQHRLAVGVASALPVSIAHIAKWAKAAASRGVLLVPITAAVTKEKQS